MPSTSGSAASASCSNWNEAGARVPGPNGAGQPRVRARRTWLSDVWFLGVGIVAGIHLDSGQVFCGRSCLGGSDALVDRDGLAEVGPGGWQGTGARGAAGGAFERPGLVQGTADLAGE